MKGIEPYSQAWPQKYAAEAVAITGAFGQEVKDVQHIGSTAIPGALAKPIIDIGVLVHSIDEPESFVKQAELLGYSYKPELSSPERLFFRKGNPVGYHLSISSPRYTFCMRQILFRDYLRAHPEQVQEYNRLKQANLGATPHDEMADLSLSETYNRGKGEFVEKILQLAEMEHSNTNNGTD